MTLRWLLAFLHLLALPIGAAALIARATTLRSLGPGMSPRRAFAADNWWSIAAVIWISTGLIRYLGRFEKGADYYEGNTFFLLKMALLVLILVLEVPSGMTLVRWRIRSKRGEVIDTSKAQGLARLNYVQVALLAVMIALATAMARGFDL